VFHSRENDAKQHKRERGGHEYVEGWEGVLLPLPGPRKKRVQWSGKGGEVRTDGTPRGTGVTVKRTRLQGTFQNRPERGRGWPRRKGGKGRGHGRRSAVREVGASQCGKSKNFGAKSETKQTKKQQKVVWVK